MNQPRLDYLLRYQDDLSTSGWNYLTSNFYKLFPLSLRPTRNFSSLSSRLYLHFEFSASCCEPKGLYAHSMAVYRRIIINKCTDFFQLFSSLLFILPKWKRFLSHFPSAFSPPSTQTTFEENFLLIAFFCKSEKFVLLARLYLRK